MPRRVRAVGEMDPDDAIPGEVVTAAEVVSQLQEEDRISAFLASVGGQDSQAYIKVLKVRGPGQKDSFVTKMSVNEWDEEAFRLQWGAGTYKLLTFTSDGSIKGSPHVYLEELPPDVRREKEAQMREERGERFVQPQQNDNTAVLLAGFQQIAQALNNRKAMLEEMQMMANLFRGAPVTASPTGDPTALMTMFLKGLEFAKGLQSDIKPGETTEMDILGMAAKELIPMLTQGLAAQTPQVRGPAQALRTPLAQTDARGAAHEPAQFPQADKQLLHRGGDYIPPPKPATVEDEMSIALRMLGNMLVSNAKANNNPETYADVLLDSLPADKLSEFLGKPDWWEQLVMNLPEAAPHKVWFGELRETVMQSLGLSTTPVPRAVLTPLMPASINRAGASPPEGAPAGLDLDSGEVSTDPEA